ncbi:MULTISPECIES: DUF2165 family protein [Pseudomonas]|uniref:DUF2165 family protein n=1 Tax=Pseudomonas TaxID=286 RepID=UPI000CD30697|nr:MULTISPECIES: DUF2165 domain-containing protein [unclassified Pseudomonas]POA32311.1 hypothetical protein C1887_09795 [Pseudomonas sp. GW456-R21]POA68851.1 hypothetical protein C1884_08305 [Pseudomonas sp. GW460-R15]
MINFTTACLIRRSKLLLVLMAGGFGLLIVFSNVTDYASNYEFVGHILSMDTTRPNETLRYRAITSPMLHHRIYWMIITLETTYTACCLLGAYQLYTKLNAPRKEFHEAKKYGIVGLMIGIFVYYFCIQVIANEWFDMDTSAEWNAMAWTRSIIGYMMTALIYLSLKTDN